MINDPDRTFHPVDVRSTLAGYATVYRPEDM
ncbi:hypothetical protein ABIA35_001326 [Catenulispora sp. MAP12-49]